MSWASAVTNAAIVKNAKEKNPAVLYLIFNHLCSYLIITQLSYVFDGPSLICDTPSSKPRPTDNMAAVLASQKADGEAYKK